MPLAYTYIRVNRALYVVHIQYKMKLIYVILYCIILHKASPAGYVGLISLQLACGMLYNYCIILAHMYM